MLASALVNSLVNAVSTTSLASPGAAAGAASGVGPTPFAGLFHDAVKNENELEQQASSAVEGLMDGSGVDIHTAMIATEKADTAFQLALAVRSKAVGAYQQIMGMQF